jgi:hypothetical protein
MQRENIFFPDNIFLQNVGRQDSFNKNVSN